MTALVRVSYSVMSNASSRARSSMGRGRRGKEPLEGEQRLLAAGRDEQRHRHRSARPLLRAGVAGVSDVRRDDLLRDRERASWLRAIGEDARSPARSGRPGFRKLSRMTYRGLILDFGGVVTTDFGAAVAAFSAREGLDAGAFARAIGATQEGREALVAVESGQLSQRDFEVTLGRLLRLDDNGLLARAMADLRPRPEVVGLARRARAGGIRVAVLSNSWGTGDYDAYAGYELDGLFDAVVISDQVGLRKPSPRIYELTAARLGLGPAECLFVDDTEYNLRAARELGLGTLHFTGAHGQVAEIERLIGLA